MRPYAAIVMWSCRSLALSTAAIVVGCAVQTMSPPEHNYALARHGSYVVATRGVGGHRADTLINGVADAARWADGEGWEAPFVRQGSFELRSPGMDQRRMSSGYAQVEIRLTEPRRVNRVVVHALDSDEYPFKGIESGELLVRSPRDSTDVWRTVATIEKGKVMIRRQLSGAVEARTVIRFETEDINGVRLHVYETGEAARLPSGGSVRRAIADTVRLLEIEISGPEALDLVDTAATSPSDQPPAPPRATVGLPAPPFELPDARAGHAVALSDHRGRVVLLYLFTPFADTSTMIDLSELRAAFESPDLVVLGLSHESTDGRQTRHMIERYHVNFPVLLADEATVTRYEGLGSAYLVGRDGVLLDRFAVTRARDMRPLLEAVIAGGDASDTVRRDH
ncbi:redoxin domain-containing protein [Candidatus Poribacteria bacterium]|jgi:peroxiredoxin|nr:redoxin domain-containing protein [Candidatus Poribacteria bacterium]MBT5710143.1 redoxin domain-containing protein [Candidatus Poribacteria bacterium]MBT7805703.1 redoxin domain-containing protein [Candidatus Poribacteria bacterium]